MPRADFRWGLDDNGDGFHLFAVADQPADTDPIDGTTEKLLFGWKRADGTTSPLVTGERRVVERGSDGRPLKLELRGRDELGRELVVDGECVNWLRWPHALPGLAKRPGRGRRGHLGAGPHARFPGRADL